LEDERKEEKTDGIISRTIGLAKSVKPVGKRNAKKDTFLISLPWI
jgi:hypothetical protein